MDTEIAIPGFLKFLALAITCASAIWGMATRTTVDAEDGRKRLTPAGHVAVALALGSFLIAGGTYGFEVIAKQNSDAMASARDAIKEAKEERRARDQEEYQRRQEEATAVEALERRALAAESRISAADQRVLTLTLAEQQRSNAHAELLRDYRLGRSVLLGSQANLRRTDAALTQLERVLHPIGSVFASVTWQLPGSDPQVRAASERLAEFGRRVRADSAFAAGSLGVNLIRSRTSGAVDRIQLDSVSEHYPKRFMDTALLNAVSRPRTNIAFLSPPKAERTIAALQTARAVETSLLPGVSDYLIEIVGEDRPTITYYLDSGNIEFETRTPITGTQPGRQSDAIISVPDLELATVLIDNDRGASRASRADGQQTWELRRAMRVVLLHFHLQTARRTYRLTPPALRTVRTDNGHVFFLAARLGRPTRR